jgi:hypothetical protein
MISKENKSMIHQLVDKEKELQYTPKDKQLRAEIILLTI